MNWEFCCRNAFETHFETLYKDKDTRAKKWVRVQRSVNTGLPSDEVFIQYFGPNDEGPFEGEEGLKKFLSNAKG